MPRRRKTRKPTRPKRRIYRTRRTYRKKRNVPRTLGFPNQKLLKMKYVTNTHLNPGLGSISAHVFRANSIFDPDQTGIGHQPMGHDQIAEFYNHYVVHGAKLTVQFNSFSNSSLSPPVVGILHTDDTSFTTTDPTVLMEQNKGQYRLLAHTYQSRPTTMVSKFSTKKFFNVTDVKDNLDRLGAPIGSNPTEEAYFVVWCGALDNTDDITGVNALITLEYIVSFSEPKEIAQS